MKKRSPANTSKPKKRAYTVDDLYTTLEAITHAASHQLKDPLRRALLNLDELQHFYSSVPVANSRQVLFDDTISAISLVIRRIELIREFSFLVENKHEPTLLDCNQILVKSIAKLNRHISERKALITSDPLPKLMGKEDQLVSLFMHLIDNAIMFNESAPPKIHILAKDQGKVWEFLVTDNGIGLEEVYRDFVFSLFMSLDKVGNTHGMGLALCQQIVRNHGGKIWFTPEEQGTCFHFTIAKQ